MVLFLHVARFFIAVILDRKGGDAGSVSPGVEKSLRTVQRERDDLTTKKAYSSSEGLDNGTEK